MPECQICKRATRGFGWYDIELPKHERKIHWACSSGCMYMISDYKGDYEVSKEIEQSALWDGLCAGGQYLDTLGKYSIDQLSRDEYMAYGQAVLDAFSAKLREEAANNVVPF